MRRKSHETVGAVHTHTHTHTGIFKLIIIAIVVAVSFLLNIFTSYEISIFALKKENNFAEEITIIDENEVSAISTEDENGNINYDDEVSVASVSVSETGLSSVGAATLNVDSFDSSSYTSFTVSGSLAKTTYDGQPTVYLNASSLSAGSSLSGTITLEYSNVRYW